MIINKRFRLCVSADTASKEQPAAAQTHAAHIDAVMMMMVVVAKTPASAFVGWLLTSDGVHIFSAHKKIHT